MYRYGRTFILFVEKFHVNNIVLRTFPDSRYCDKCQRHEHSPSLMNRVGLQKTS